MKYTVQIIPSDVVQHTFQCKPIFTYEDCTFEHASRLVAKNKEIWSFDPDVKITMKKQK